jgi:hypothetical protein
MTRGEDTVPFSVITTLTEVPVMARAFRELRRLRDLLG